MAELMRESLLMQQRVNNQELELETELGLELGSPKKWARVEVDEEDQCGSCIKEGVECVKPK